MVQSQVFWNVACMVRVDRHRAEMEDCVIRISATSEGLPRASSRGPYIDDFGLRVQSLSIAAHGRRGTC